MISCPSTRRPVDQARSASRRSALPWSALLHGRASSPHYVHESDRVLLDDTARHGRRAQQCAVGDLPSLEPGGPREYIYFDPARTRVGDRDLRRPVPGPEQRDPRPGPRAGRQLRRHRRGRLPRRLSAAWSAASEPVRLTPRRGGGHPQPGRHHPRHLARRPGPGGDGRRRWRGSAISVLFVIGGDGTLRGAQRDRRRGGRAGRRRCR